MCPFSHRTFVVTGKVLYPSTCLRWMDVVTQTDIPMSVRNRCVIDVLVAFLRCQLVFEFSVGIGAFVIGLNPISFSFSVCVYIFQVYFL